MDNYHNNLVIIITFKPSINIHNSHRHHHIPTTLPNKPTSIPSIDNSGINNINIPINENINLRRINANNNTISMHNVSNVSINKKRISFPQVINIYNMHVINKNLLSLL
eukprot:289418_1